MNFISPNHVYTALIKLCSLGLFKSVVLVLCQNVN